MCPFISEASWGSKYRIGLHSPLMFRFLLYTIVLPETPNPKPLNPK